MKVMTKRYKKTEKQAHREPGGKRDGRKHEKEVSEGAVAPVEERTLERSWDIFPKMGGG